MAWSLKGRKAHAEMLLLNQKPFKEMETELFWQLAMSKRMQKQKENSFRSRHFEYCVFDGSSSLTVAYRVAACVRKIKREKRLHSFSPRLPLPPQNYVSISFDQIPQRIVDYLLPEMNERKKKKKSCDTMSDLIGMETGISVNWAREQSLNRYSIFICHFSTRYVTIVNGLTFVLSMRCQGALCGVCVLFLHSSLFFWNIPLCANVKRK